MVTMDMARTCQILDKYIQGKGHTAVLNTDCDHERKIERNLR